MKLLILLATIFGFQAMPPAQAKTGCLNIPTCNLLADLLPSKEGTELLINYTGDPHNFRPTIEDSKRIIDYSSIVLGPVGLESWHQELGTKRAGKKTLKLSIEGLKSEFNSANTHALSHYWLYPDIHCKIRKSMAKYFELDEASCPFRSQMDRLLKLKSKKFPLIVITHSALEPLFEFLDAKYVALKSSHHFDHLNPELLKIIHKNSKGGKKMVWIIEKEIRHPPKIVKNYKKQHHLTLKLNIRGEFGGKPGAVVDQLLNFLEAI
ncbi:MAG: hypothetical protein HOE90_00045 [Bacteriovoracaceae bacterium]|jgi:hypothetical protein|nr:hypothetical protein [Bacteriovoracaceae bacterium]